MSRTRIALCAAIAAVALLAVAATAGADNTAQNQQPFPPGELFGGGRVGYGKFSDPPNDLAEIRMSKDRTQLNIVNIWNVTCADGSFFHTATYAYNVPFNINGTFAGSVPYHDSGPDGHVDGTYSYQGRFEGADPVRGTSRLEATQTLNNGKSTTCDTKNVAWVMRDPFAAPGTGKLKKRAGYYGLQSDNRQIVLRVDTKKKKVRDLYFSVYFDKTQCTGQTSGLHQIGTGEPIKIKKGKFKKTDSVQLFGESGNPTYKWKLSGKFGKKRVVGKLQYQADIHNAAGKAVSHCTSPKLTVALERA